ncbi:hypothetical protein [Sediminicola luteus]|uniref:Uncharacterized protein n=1 Tax=Sediminicola luteus TaxID=319238 RepID=A0ABV2TXS3_9FLAO
MLPTLFIKKHKSTSSKSATSINKQPFYNLERLLSDLGIKFSKSEVITIQELKQVKKVSATNHAAPLPNDLQQIAINQMAYSKLMEERLNKSPFGHKKGKVISLRS